MKKIKFITAGLVAAALSLTAVTGAQAYPPGVKPGIVITGGIAVNNKDAVVKIKTKEGAELVVTINGKEVFNDKATSGFVTLPVSWKKYGKYTIVVNDQDSTKTSVLYVPHIVTPAKGKIKKAGKISFKFVDPGTIVSVKVNGKVVLKSYKIPSSGGYIYTLTKKFLKKGKNKITISVGKTNINKVFIGS